MIAMTTTWDETRAMLARLAGPVAAIVAVALVLPTILSGLANLWQQERPLAEASGTASLVGLIGIAGTIAMIWGQLSLTALALGTDGAGRALSTGAARLPRMLLVVLVLALAIVVLTLPVILILAAAGVDMSRMMTPGAPGGISPGAASSVLLYLLVLLPILLVLVARIALVSPVVVAERRHLGALAASWRLTRGLTLKLCGVLFLYLIVSALIWAATRIVLGSLLLIALGDGSPLNPATVAITIVSAVVSGGLSAVSTLFVAILYRRIVAARETPAEPLPA